MRSERLEILIFGLVQGVGFRPHIYRVAKRLNLTGFVQNNAAGVLVEVQGCSVDDFITQLKQNLPPLAKIDDIRIKSLAVKYNETEFEIVESQCKGRIPGQMRTNISPDMCLCSLCLQELFDPQSRYFHYPFLSCTHCGPRLTITRNLPYDRCHTAMDVFPLCEACKIEYNDPRNRRYHAQSTACMKCGPRFSLSIEEIVQRILNGKIIAVKGVGGYQLISDARNVATIQNLRKRKNREAKPFALMLSNISSARAFADISAMEEKVLVSKERPIVLLRKNNSQLPEIIAPGLSYLGIMLPSSPLHYLIFNALAGYPQGCDWIDTFESIPLIVTSANVAGTPLVIDDAVAEQELKNIADVIVTYNRKIETRVDDSVVRVINSAPFFIRRARAYVPTCIKLPYAVPSTLALGGHLKNTFCITRGDEAFVSQYLGSLTNKPSIEFFQETLDYFLKFLDVKPERIAHDWHPDFYTTGLALECGLPTIGVQHHHAHLASVAAEWHIDEPALGLALDGYGYGSDGQAWGGELLHLEHTSFTRIGHLYPIPQPGADIAAREPWRMAAGVMHDLGLTKKIPQFFSAQKNVHLIAQFLEQNTVARTSSCGRLFDAASAILGITHISQYEGQAAAQLESLVTAPQVLPNGWTAEGGIFNMLPTLKHLLKLDPVEGANVFHGTLMAGLAEWLFITAQKISVDVILLSGGCFLNKVLTEGLINRLQTYGLKPFIPRSLPPSDGGICLGQAYVAGRINLKDESCA